MEDTEIYEPPEDPDASTYPQPPCPKKFPTDVMNTTWSHIDVIRFFT